MATALHILVGNQNVLGWLVVVVVVVVVVVIFMRTPPTPYYLESSW
jgi:hypothetical protein